MATTAEHIAARNDPDLRARLEAIAEQHGVKNAGTWVEEKIGALITAPAAGEQTIADVHGYANGEYRRILAEVPERPGLNPAAVTDAHLAAAVAAVLSA